MWLSWVHVWMVWGPEAKNVSKMVDLGCQDTDWVGGNNKDVLDAILWQDGLILANLSVDKGKCGYLS